MNDLLRPAAIAFPVFSTPGEVPTDDLHSGLSQLLEEMGPRHFVVINDRTLVRVDDRDPPILKRVSR